MIRAIPNRLQLHAAALLFALVGAVVQLPFCSLSETKPVLELRLGYNIVVGDVQAAATIMKLQQHRMPFGS